MRGHRSRIAAPVALALLTGLSLFLGACSLAAPESGSPATGSPATTSPASASPTPAVTVPVPTPEPTFLTYVVRRGDTLISIAKRFRTTVDSIGYWNRSRYATLDPDSASYAPDDLKVGWLLLIRPDQTTDGDDLEPTPSASDEAPSPSDSAKPSGTPVAVVSPAPTPPPTPTPTPRPTASARPSPSPSPTAAVASRLVTHGSRTRPEVALTFDMGGRQTDALAIVDWLVAHGVRATIFTTGESGSTTIGRQVLARVAAHPELFTLGNHSWDHPYFTGLTAAEMADQLDRCEAAVSPLAGTTTRPLFRPPYGSTDATVLAGVGAAGWRYTVKWDVDTIDWKPESQGGPTTADIEAKVLAGAQDGSIVLMHLGGYNTLAALPAIVAGLAERGLTPVRLADWWH